MKIVRYILMMFCAVAAASCDNDEPTLSVKSITPSAQGDFTDTRDGQQYHWVRIGNQEWFTSNLSYAVVDEYGELRCKIYVHPEMTQPETEAESAKNLSRYGYLYDFQTAMAAVNEIEGGWRLPSDEDWMELEQALGLSAQECNETGWRGSKIGLGILFKQNEGTKLALKFGGMYNVINQKFIPQFIGVSGYFWSSTLDPLQTEPSAFYRKVGYYENGVERQSTFKTKRLSVRLVRDVKKLI